MRDVIDENHPLFVLAKIIQSNSDGPVKLKVVGNQAKINGKEPLVKAGYRSMPWESERGELPVMRMAEVSSRVLSILTQPHRLEIRVPSLDVKVEYTPDILLMCDPTFVKEVVAGEPFWRCAQKSVRTRISEDAPVRFVLEVKRRSDRSLEDANYLAKIGLAHSLYALAGISFAVVTELKGISEEWLPTVNEMTAKKFVECSQFDRMKCLRVCGNKGFASFGELAAAFAGGNSGKHKVYSLHIHRHVSIDLTADLNDLTPVWLMTDTQEHHLDRCNYLRHSRGPRW